MSKNVIKRDGRIVEFDKNKIYNAITKAMKETNVEDVEFVEKTTNLIEEKVKDNDNIENIQDIIEKELMRSKYKNVAKNFITYREKRTQERQRKDKLNKAVRDVIQCKSIQNSNANVDEHSFSGRKSESSAIIQKEIALNDIVRPEIAKAHRDGVLYLHDLDSYAIGNHNCLFADIGRLLANGFTTRNGDVRAANSFSTACQLVAVIFQIQSQVQFGGVASCHLDYDLAPYVKKSFVKKFKEGLAYIEPNIALAKSLKDEDIYIDNEELKETYPKVYQYAIDMLNKEGRQATQGLYHNLNTLESRAGSQVPFTSINIGRDTSVEGKLVNKWIIEASLDGVGKNHMTPIFPISIFNYKKGVNDIEGTPNYDLKKLAIKSLCKRIYPNISNGDWSQNVENGNPDTQMATMG